MKRLPGVFGALALLAPGVYAQGSMGTVQPSKVVVTKDTSLRAGDKTVLVRSLVIDSLITRLKGLPLGSAEFLATDSALQKAMRDAPRSPGLPQGIYRFEVVEARPTLRMSLLDVVPQGTMGFTADGVSRVSFSPAGNYIEYFEYPTIMAIETNSPASRVGLRIGDSLIAYDGRDVRSNPVNMTKLLTPGREVTVKLRRDGEAKDVVVEVEKAPDRVMVERRAAVTSMMVSSMPQSAEENRRIFEERVAVAARAAAPQGGPATTKTSTGNAVVVAGAKMQPTRGTLMTNAPVGVYGAAMTDVDENLATAIRGMDGKRGVFVTFVPPGSMADRVLGLRGGDVILRVESIDVSTMAEMRIRMHMAEQAGAEKVKLTILRAGKTQDVSYAPPR